MAYSKEQKKKFITILLILSGLLFLFLIKGYLITLVLAVIFAGILYPTYEKLSSKLKGKHSLSAVLLTIGFLLLIIVPSFYLLSEIIRQAGEITEKIVPFIEEEISSQNSPHSLPDWFPFAEELQPYSDQIKAEGNQLIGKIGNVILNGITSFTAETFNFIMYLLIMLYAMYFFLLNGKNLVNRFGKFLPISENQYDTLKSELLNTSWATIKGAVVIGLIQGALVGISFAIAGIHGAVFWGAIAALASLIPSVGCALVYVPAAAYLLATGQQWEGIFVLLWGLIIVGMVDNVLRPILVGKDTQISELTVLISTLGGIAMFGLSGVILGPVVASLLTTVSNIYLEYYGDDNKDNGKELS